MKQNNKGFTLIEIVATVTILGILTAIAIISVTKIIEKGKKQHYITAEQNMVLAGQSYVQQNRNELPKAIGQRKKIPLSELVEKNYIQPVKDYNDNVCDVEKSYIQVYKYSQTDYSYLAYLECPKYNSENNINNLTPDITAKIKENEEKLSVSANITITGNDKIMSYSYIIYRDSKEVKNTGSIAINGTKESMTINFSLDDYVPSQIKIVITAVNTYGNTKTKVLSEKLEDTKGPKCIIQEEDQNEKEWTTEDRTITVGCDDGGGSGCTKETFTKTFTTTTKMGTVTIKDKAGNKTDCEVKVYVDKTAPSCTQTGGSTAWTTGNRTISWGCDDGTNQSGCNTSYDGGSTTYSQTTKTASISAYTIKDNAGNQTSCPTRTADVYVEKCSSTTTTWGAWNTCSKTCGGGTRTRTGTKYSAYGNNCGTTSESQDCNTHSCCSKSNPTGCPKKHACRGGYTNIFNIPKEAGALGGTVTDEWPLYIISEVGNMYYVFTPRGTGFYFNTTDKADYGYDSKLDGFYVYIYKTCLADWGKTCEYKTCPG